MSSLVIRNSLTKKKELFRPWKEDSKSVTCYICGPTVYDSAHVGHARNYLSFDTIRRILEGYFGFEVELQMNVTDVDDKIIKKSKELQEDFCTLSGRYEREFWEDLDKLNCLPPTYITRVTDYIPEIINFIEKLVERGYAYEAGGSVYFDVQTFTQAGFKYGQLEQTSVGDIERLMEGEGSWASQQARLEKKSAGDFALWKRSQEDEPGWSSPWGYGRPGWHVECSTMASCIFGSHVDMHCGGEDLRFPHHENEIAQSEAYFEKNEWVKFFLHSGHLHIEGLKMSKSLKNFITIRSILERYTPRQLRLFILQHHYAARMNYSEQGMQEAVNVEKFFAEFFRNFFALEREYKKHGKFLGGRKFRESGLCMEFRKRKEEIHEAFCDDFDTPAVIRSLQALVKTTNLYIQTETNNDMDITLMRNIVRYVTKILTILGLGRPSSEESGFWDEVPLQKSSNEEFINGLIDIFVDLRDRIRGLLIPLLKQWQKKSFNAEMSRSDYDSESIFVCVLIHIIIFLFRIARFFSEELDACFESFKEKIWLLKDNEDLQAESKKLFVSFRSQQSHETEKCLDELLNLLVKDIESLLTTEMCISKTSGIVSGLYRIKTVVFQFVKWTFNFFQEFSVIKVSQEDLKSFLSHFLQFLETDEESEMKRQLLLATMEWLPRQFVHLAKCVVEELDDIRDKKLIEYGIRIEDSGKGSRWKIEDPEELKREMVAKAQQESAKLEEKKKRQEEAQKRLLEELNRGRVPPGEMFKQGDWQGHFSKYDADGVPTHDIENNEIPKSQRKKLIKEYEKQRKLHEKYLHSMNKF
ncbi:hypothetical protein GpartN1_g799.t1 [Galdieria partita]|uniref:cysteine--tRNA ligase n=1 Tax=Galdieria partita TaxID=83374 RepID=A0A9C7UMV5_9RHOD|nr:hypothetical protein GpartN1_g799.t1 [Galdieria partita]